MNDEFEGCFTCNARVMKVFFLGEHVIDDDEFEDVLYKLNQSFKCSPNEMY